MNENDARFPLTRSDDSAGLKRRRRAELQALEAASAELIPRTLVDATTLLHELRVHQIELEMQNEELRTSQAALDASRARYLELYDLAPVGYVTLDDSGLITRVNLRLCEMLAVPRADVLRQPFSRFVDPEDQDVYYLERRRVHSSEGPQVFEVRLLRGDGSSFWTRLEVAPISDADLASAVCRLAASDISKQRELEHSMAHANRMASMGVLAAGVAHEINNPLTLVLYNTEALANRLRVVNDTLRQGPGPPARVSSSATPDLGAPIEDVLDELASMAFDAAAATRRIRDIARGLTLYARHEPIDRSPVDLTTSIEAAIQFAANEIKARAVLIKDLGPQPKVLANGGRLEQVFLNLLINACHAITEENGRDNRISVRTWAKADAVFAEVSDTGVGIRPEDIESVFEPFFTTKARERGTGLGLAISRGIVEEFGGQIKITSTRGEGTQVVVRLPRDLRPDVSAAQPGEPVATSSPPGKILVVDDEAMIRKIIGRLLESEHEVVIADSAPAARELVDQDPTIDLVLCDIMMPGESGLQLHAWLSKHYGHLAQSLVFITGGVFVPAVEAALAELPNPVVQKPFDVTVLLDTVKAQLVLSRGARD